MIVIAVYLCFLLTLYLLPHIPFGWWGWLVWLILSGTAIEIQYRKVMKKE